MNYIKELNAFRNWLLLSEIPTSAIALWYTLMAINNSVGWKSSFNAPNSVVQQLTGLSKQGLLNARNELIEHNLICCEKGKKGKAPVYKMVSLVNSVDQCMYQSVYQSLDPSLDESLTIPKQKLKQKQKSRRGEKEAENPFLIFEQNFGILRPIAGESLIAWCEDLGDDIVVAAIKLAVKRGGHTYSYIEKILKEWAHAKLTSIDRVRDYERQKAANRDNTIPFRKRTEKSRQTLFDELRQEGSLP
ncbi:DnaD domain protein [Virgibacillus sp. C22-A2]|uniref:DnaD domain protein n=1 Tax=Virgibacillus tibetensis TaxID=3042313 RepID=A0ABU6KJ04_9BACI|nr:DnaD domain protein [Virgibacillus sp. C22-A2]